MWNQKPSFRIAIDNFSEKKYPMPSKTFVAGGCEWFLSVYTNGDPFSDHDHFSMYLHVANQTMLRPGWKRNVSFYFTLLNQSDKELCRSHIVPCKVFDVINCTFCGFSKLCPLSTLQENGLLEKDRLIIEVYINLIEADDGESGDVSEKEETVDILGFKVLASHVTLVRKIFAEHPDIAVGLKSKNQVLKTAYMNVLIGLINTLNKPSHNHSETELNKAESELSELEEVGFKLDWLKSKLEEVILERKKADAYGNKVIQLEERMKNLEQMEKNRMIAEHFLERKKAKDDGSGVQTLEERVKNLEAVDSSFRMDCLKSKFEGVSLEKKQLDDADGSRVQQLEENLKNLEEIVSDLKVKLDQGKEKNSCDGFLLVDEDEVA